MRTGCVVRKGEYFDSVFLMRVADRISAHPGVAQVAAIMATPANKVLLTEAGLSCAETDTAGSNDLIVAVAAEDQDVISATLAQLDSWLAGDESTSAPEERVRTLEQAISRLSGANLAVISVPGEHAAREARVALEQGVHVFMFSDNVPVEDEIALKRLASERGLVVMGPDCGTAIIRGIGIGFANVVRRGPIGVVGASGTGIQELTTLVDRAGSGISHAIGTGSHDPGDEVGGLTTIAGIAALEADRATAAIVLISKPPGPHTLERIRERVARARKPVIACFLGSEVAHGDTSWELVRTLDEAAAAALQHVGIGDTSGAREYADDAAVSEHRSALTSDQRYVRGLFAGGSLCYQAQDIFALGGIRVRSNAPLVGMEPMDDPRRSTGHAFLDLGADEFTRGRPHPMIDSRLRRDRILAEGDDPTVAVLLLDVILGYGCAADPAGDLADAIVRARDTSARRGGRLAVVVSVVGTDADPQGFAAQATALRDAGATVCPSSADAARLAANIVSAA